MDQHKAVLLKEVIQQLPPLTSASQKSTDKASSTGRHSMGQNEMGQYNVGQREMGQRAAGQHSTGRHSMALAPVLDCTFGRGGHTRAILEHNARIHITALDCDEAAFYAAQDLQREFADRLKIIHGNFIRVEELLPKQNFMSILLDLGVSSPQLDTPERGFSYYHKGRLDMRMDRSQSLTAERIINTWPEEQLFALFRDKGEIKSPHKVLRQILRHRDQKAITCTHELSQLIEKATGWKRKHHHPATKYFMALRLEVNQELENLEHALPQLLHKLMPGGRLLIIFFHSLEGRIIKHVFKQHSALGQVINKNVIRPLWAEKQQNPRSRSAGLKVFQRSC